MTQELTFTAELWEHRGPGAWHFVTVSEAVSDEIADLTAGRASGFGSVRVAVAIGSTRWETSLFPSAADRAYVLPVKKAVRTAEGLQAGDRVTVRITLR